MDDFFFAEQCFYPSCDFVVFGKCDGNLAIDYVSMTATRLRDSDSDQWS